MRIGAEVLHPNLWVLRLNIFLLAAAGCLACLSSANAGNRLNVAAAEQVYADIASQIGGDAVVVRTLKQGADGNAKTSRSDLILYEGGSYDSWIGSLVSHYPASAILEASSFASGKRGRSPLAWYNLNEMRAFSTAYAEALERLAPNSSGQIASRLSSFQHSLDQIETRINEVRKLYAGTDVILLGDAFRSIASDLQLKAHLLAPHQKPADGKAQPNYGASSPFEGMEGAVLIYDRDRHSAEFQHSVDTAKESGIPAVGITESMPQALHYQGWLIREINAVHGALNQASQ